jgi:hypothetical protein
MLALVFSISINVEFTFPFINKPLPVRINHETKWIARFSELIGEIALATILGRIRIPCALTCKYSNVFRKINYTASAVAASPVASLTGTNASG